MSDNFILIESSQDFTIVGGSEDQFSVFPGAQGPKGDPGEGVPTGGTTGQVLTKRTDEDYDTEWVAPDAGVDPATATPLMDGTAAVGVSDKYAREDHVHPTDTTRASADDLTALQNATLITDTASGSIASFTDGADGLPMKQIIADIDPVQDLNGYDSPWPPGGGKNQIKPATDRTAFGVTYTNNSDGSATVNGTSTGAFICNYYQNSGIIPFDTEGTWTLSGMNSTITGECYIQVTVRNKSDDSIYARRRITPSDPTFTFTVTSEQYISDMFFRMSNGSSATNAKIYPMLEKSSTPHHLLPLLQHLPHQRSRRSDNLPQRSRHEQPGDAPHLMAVRSRDSLRWQPHHQRGRKLCADGG